MLARYRYRIYRTALTLFSYEERNRLDGTWVPLMTASPRADDSGGTVLRCLIANAKACRVTMARELMKVGIYLGQDQVLNVLWAEDGQTQAELADRIGAMPPTVSKMLRRMEVGGLVRRMSRKGRDRSVRIFLTEQGRALQEPIVALWKRVDEELTADLTGSERDTLIRLLAKLRMPDELDGI